MRPPRGRFCDGARRRTVVVGCIAWMELRLMTGFTVVHLPVRGPIWTAGGDVTNGGLGQEPQVYSSAERELPRFGRRFFSASVVLAIGFSAIRRMNHGYQCVPYEMRVRT